ncbi:uncharacterized protein HKW66_Vig0130470 [Vigna angularis]|uniref:Ubiquitin-like protease family profile domain-containing protein n=1 Tax=Phaseolus angularis TaxID=3914 RepID=A0A8T0K4Q4_PHAAN|nr:uncharacterized protein LOC108336570 [Vigna angularis]KAG2391192.1 uncharacterized protein HKW66_Vig0130470 [Vigna angularis]
MNSLLAATHKMRISQTPFKWCLEIGDPLEVNLKLLKKMVRRWVPHHQSFRVSQHLVPFNVQDVFMTLGLGVGGLEVPFDESVVGKVGESFNSKCTKLKDLIDMFNVLVGNDDSEVDRVCRLYVLVCFVVFFFPRKARYVSNMPCSVLDDLDSLSSYDWSSAVHRYLVDSLNRCNKKLLSGSIADSLSISGNAVVLQLWAYERLGLHDDDSAKEFPRVRRFSSLNYTKKKIDVMFKTAEVQFDWFLSENDCLNPIIRRAFNLDEGLRREGSEREEKVEEKAEENAEEKAEENAEEKVAENEYDENWLLSTLEKLRTNNARIRKVRDEIAAVRKLLADRVKYRKVEQSPSFHEQHEEPACTMVVEEEVVAADHPIVVVDVGDGVDDGEGEVDVQPLNVLALCSFVGDPKTVVDFDKLYHAVTRRDIPRRYVSEIMYQLLSTSECSSLGPRQCVDNMALIFAATMFMYFEKRLTGVIKRIVFSPMFGTHVLHDYRKRPVNQHVWQLLDYQPYFRYDLVRVEALLSADWVFIPIVSDGHWWCYALKVCTFQFYVIDSLANGIKGRCRIDRSIAQNIQRLWGLLTDKLEETKCPLLVEKANIPVQPNTYDCGVIMMKAIEIWDAEDKYDGKSMPDYTNEELAAFRKNFICDWILDEDNVRRMDTLQHFGLL